MRVVGREQEQLIAADVLERAHELLDVAGGHVDRLQREADVVADDIGGRRSSHGTSARTPRQVLLMRHSKVGSQVKRTQCRRA